MPRQAEPRRGQDHGLLGLDAVRLHPHHLVRLLDRLRVENYPFGLLTMIVSLEAIFLSTFVMISQNRADAKRQVIADEQWRTVQEEDHQNKELLDLSQADPGADQGSPGAGGQWHPWQRDEARPASEVTASLSCRPAMSQMPYGGVGRMTRSRLRHPPLVVPLAAHDPGSPTRTCSNRAEGSSASQ